MNKNITEFKVNKLTGNLKHAITNETFPAIKLAKILFNIIIQFCGDMCIFIH